PRRALTLLPALLAAAFVAASVAASTFVADHARDRNHLVLGDDLSWVDHDVNGPVAYFYAGEPEWDVVWRTVFCNRRIDRVYDYPGTSVLGPLPQQPSGLTPDGSIRAEGGRSEPAQYAVAA